MSDTITYTQGMKHEIAAASHAIVGQFAHADAGFTQLFQALTFQGRPEVVESVMKGYHEPMMDQANLLAKYRRENPRAAKMPSLAELRKARGGPEIAKANLDVGTLTNFAQITGGQSLGYVSLDTNLARGTVRPSSFTIYQCLHKTRAFQVVDYWSYVSTTGGAPPGAAVGSYSGVSSGTLATSAGTYLLENITLKLAYDGRAITTALAAQNSFVDIGMQENTNAALTVLQTLNYLCYWGNATTYPNQFNGIDAQVPAANKIDFQGWYNTYGSAQGWNNAQGLFNLIYQWAGQLSTAPQFAHPTHAFMSPFTAGSLQQLVTTLLNNIATNINGQMAGPNPIVINGDLQGMKTRFGEIQFPIDIFINYRDVAIQAYDAVAGTSIATSTLPTPPTTVTVATSGNTGTAWTATYAATGMFTTYAVASADASSLELTLTWATPISGIVTGGSYVVTVTGIVAGTQALRVFRSGLCTSATQVTGGNAAAVRHVGTVLASGTAGVTFQDVNAKIPGSEVVFLLDMAEEDMAIDYRWLLPLTKIELFAQNLYMPWAVAAIGAIRLRVPKFHGMILNYVPDNPEFNPLSANVNAVP